MNESLSEFEFLECSYDPYLKPIIEIWFRNEHLAIVSNDSFERVELFGRVKGEWDFEYKILSSALEYAINLSREATS